MRVNLYKQHFLSSHFLSQPNKGVFDSSTFPSFKPNTYNRKLNLFPPISYLPTIFYHPLFLSPNQTKPKNEGLGAIYYHSKSSQTISPSLYTIFRSS